MSRLWFTERNGLTISPPDKGGIPREEQGFRSSHRSRAGDVGHHIDHRRSVRQRQQVQQHDCGSAGGHNTGGHHDAGSDDTGRHDGPAATTAPAGTTASVNTLLDTNGDGKVVIRHRRRRARRRRRLLPGGRRRRQDALHRERLRGPDRRRQHPGRRRGDRDRRPRPAGRRRDHRRRLRDRRATARPDRQVPRHLLVLQLRRRLPGRTPVWHKAPTTAARSAYTAGYATGLKLKEKGGDSVGHHRLLRSRLREAGVHVVRARPEGGRPVVHV